MVVLVDNFKLLKLLLRWYLKWWMPLAVCVIDALVIKDIVGKVAAAFETSLIRAYSNFQILQSGSLNLTSPGTTFRPSRFPPLCFGATATPWRRHQTWQIWYRCCRTSGWTTRWAAGDYISYIYVRDDSKTEIFNNSGWKNCINSNQTSVTAKKGGPRSTITSSTATTSNSSSNNNVGGAAPPTLLLLLEPVVKTLPCYYGCVEQQEQTLFKRSAAGFDKVFGSSTKFQ